MGLLMFWFWIKLVLIVVGFDVMFIDKVLNMLVFKVKVKILMCVVFG